MSTTYHAGEHTKNKIFEVSRQLFYSKGYDETTYDDISNAANINRALIPYHFKNKKNLGLIVYRRLIDDYFSICDQALEDTSISEDVPPSTCSAIIVYLGSRILQNSSFNSTVTLITTSEWSSARSDCSIFLVQRIQAFLRKIVNSSLRWTMALRRKSSVFHIIRKMSISISFLR